MPPENMQQGHAPELYIYTENGLQPLGCIETVTFEPERPEPTWDNPHQINTIREATLTLTMAIETLGHGIQAAAKSISSLTQELEQDIEAFVILVTTDPRVRHLALHGKKRRTRKKNYHRALKEYNKKKVQRHD